MHGTPPSLTSQKATRCILDQLPSFGLLHNDPKRLDDLFRIGSADMRLQLVQLGSTLLKARASVVTPREKRPRKGGFVL